MIDRNLKEMIDRGMKNLRLIWVFMLGTLLVYLLGGLFLAGEFEAPSSGTSTLTALRWFFYIFSVITFALASFLKKAVLSVKKSPSPNTPAPGGNQHPVITRYMAAVVISLAFSEAIGIYGLVMIFLGGKKLDIVSLILLSAAAMLYYRPRREELLGLIKPRVLRGEGG